MPANLNDLFVEELRDLYHAEKQLVKALPKLAKAASARDLRQAFEHHLEETEGHVTRIEQIFKLLDETPRAKPCAGIAGIVEEGSELIKEHGKDKGPALDAGLIAGGQRAEHYEMAAYGTLKAWAEALGHEEVATLLQETLDEEKAADRKLSELAEAGINEVATVGRSEEDEEGEDEDTEGARVDEDDEEEQTGSRRARNNGSTKKPVRMKTAGNGRAAQPAKRAASRR